jgi:hypothetical protein
MIGQTDTVTVQVVCTSQDVVWKMLHKLGDPALEEVEIPGHWHPLTAETQIIPPALSK